MIPPLPERSAQACGAATLGVLAALALLLAAPTAPDARPRLGVQIKLGLSSPLTDYLTNHTLLLDRSNTEGEVNAYPYIGDVQNDTGLTFTLLATFRSLEFSLAFFSFPWAGSTLYWEGDAPATRVTAFHVDDAGVNYRALDPPLQVDTEQVATAGLSMTTFDVGYRFYLWESGFLEAYAPVGGGLVVQGEPMQCELAVVCGAHLWGGLAADLVIENLAFVFDVRFHGILTGEAIGVEEAANTAAVTDATIFQAFTSTMLFATFDIGVRWSVY